MSVNLEQGYGIGDEVLAIAEAIGETMVPYEPKLAIAHNVALVLVGEPGWGENLNLGYKEFRDAMFSAHRRVRAEWETHDA